MNACTWDTAYAECMTQIFLLKSEGMQVDKAALTKEVLDIVAEHGEC